MQQLFDASICDPLYRRGWLERSVLVLDDDDDGIPDVH